MLIVVADLFVRAVAADMRSRQAALFDQMVADGLEMLGVAVLRPAVKQDAALVGDRQQQRRIVRAARLVNRAAAQDAAVAFNRAADRLGDVLCGDVSDIHGSLRVKKRRARVGGRASMSCQRAGASFVSRRSLARDAVGLVMMSSSEMTSASRARLSVT